MRSLSEIEAAINTQSTSCRDPKHTARELLRLSEEVLEHWIYTQARIPTRGQREGFRLLALHRQGARGVPSFNACRETCRELVYHYNLITNESDPAKAAAAAAMAAMVARHLFLFVSGKIEVERLGEFCCSSKPLREAPG